jgi:poly(glycerol-phosphate) alpha-glucosyltransferase
MKIVLISGTNSRMSGGLFYSIKNLGMSMINHCGQEVTYVCHDDGYSDVDRESWKGLPLSIYHLVNLPILKRLGFSFDIHRILDAINPDIIDIQGTWMYYSYAALKYKKKHPNCKIVITPRGTLDRLKLSTMSVQKKLAYRLYEQENFEKADCFRALSVPEANSMRIFGVKVPIAVIPNGFTLPNHFANPADLREVKTILFVGRINPKKGLKEMIEGINLLRNVRPDLLQQWKFKIAGWDQNGHIEMLQELVKSYNLGESVEFLGQKYGEDKEKELLDAQAFILTSFSEGMPMSVLEAWAYKLPIVMTDGCNLPDGFEEKAALRVETTPESICDGLVKFFSMSDSERVRMGENGYNLVVKKYQWNKIADDSVELYNYLLDGGVKPHFMLE